MYKIIAKYIFSEKEPLKKTLTTRTTDKMYKTIKDIAYDNNMTVSMIVNNALAYYIMNHVKNQG